MHCELCFQNLFLQARSINPVPSTDWCNIFWSCKMDHTCHLSLITDVYQRPQLARQCSSHLGRIWAIRYRNRISDRICKDWQWHSNAQYVMNTAGVKDNSFPVFVFSSQVAHDPYCAVEKILSSYFSFLQWILDVSWVMCKLHLLCISLRCLIYHTNDLQVNGTLVLDGIAKNCFPFFLLIDLNTKKPSDTSVVNAFQLFLALQKLSSSCT